MRPHPAANQPKIIILAGPNGAGKTTFARAFLPAEAELPRFINADLIAAGLEPFAPESAAVRAARLMLQEIDHRVQRKQSFALETTLSGLAYLRHVEQWRALGYRVSLYFLQLPSAETAVARVAERVRQGGHNIPTPVIHRRFAAGVRNFQNHFRDAVDDWAHYTNAHGWPELLGWGENPQTSPEQDLALARHADLRASRAAMQRATESARKIAIQTNTAVVFAEGEKPMRVSAAELELGDQHGWG